MVDLHQLAVLAVVVAVYNVAAAESVCRAQLSSNTRVQHAASRSLVLNSFNDVLGSKQNMTFSDPSVAESLNRVPVGALRHPGGTVANYWSFANATFIHQCKVAGVYDFCSSKEALAAYPAQTFSAAEFVANIGPLLTDVNSQDPTLLPIVFDLNILTLSDEETVAQVDVLATTIPNASSRIRFIELGNEYYLTPYRRWLTNGSTYMEKAKPVIARVRQLLPNARIAMVASRPGKHGDWNSAVAPYVHLVDAITVHDYSAAIPKEDPADWVEYLLHGPVNTAYTASELRKTFGSDVPIWMTEFNGISKSDDKLTGYVAHAIFVFNYVIGGLCESGGQFELMMMHMFWGQVHNWGKHLTLFLLPLEANQPNLNEFDSLSLLFSRFGALSSNTTLEGRCMSFDDAACIHTPRTIFNLKSNVACLRGVEFTRSNQSYASVITNGCDWRTNVTLSVTGRSVRALTFTHMQTALWTAISACANDRPLYECGLTPAGDVDIVVDHNQEVVLDVAPLSVLFVYTTV